MRTKKRLIKNCTRSWEVAQVLERMVKNDPKYSDCEVNSYGPFGLCCESSVFVKRGDDVIGDLSIIEGHGMFPFYRRTFERIGDYPAGSIGDMNGMNYRSVPLPLDNQAAYDLIFARTEGAS